MNCAYHESKIGINTCSKCGHWLCEDCYVEVNGIIICKSCVLELIDSNSYNPRKSRHSTRRYEHTDDRHVHHEDAYVRPRRCEHYETPTTGTRRRISRFWLLIFSCVPGMNYMFMGLIKRGIYALSAFLFMIYCGATLNSPLLAMAAGVIFVVSVFDGFKVRRMLLDGEYVEDGFSGITKVIYRHKIPFFVIALLLIASNTFSNAYYSMRVGNMNFTFILILIAAIVYFFVKPACKTKKISDSEYIDKRDQ